MNLQSLTLRGFRSFFDEFSLEFDKGPLFLFGKNEKDPEKFRSNAAGKSTVFMALCWCLTGRLPMKVKKDEVINRQSDECFVEVAFDRLLVRRSKKRGYPESLYFRAGADEGKGDLAEVQRELSRILGIDNALFYNSLWIDGESKTVQFLFAEDAQRMEILEGLLAADLFARTRKIASDTLTEAKERRAKHTAEIDSLMAQKEREQARYERAAAALAEYDERVAAAEQKRATRRQEIETTLQDLRQQLASAKALAAKANDAAEEVKSLEHQEASWQRKMAVAEAEQATLRRLSELRAGQPCPTCGQAVAEDGLKAAIRDLKKIRKELNEAEKRWRETGQKLQAARAERREAERAEFTVESLRRQIKSLKTEYEGLNEPPADITREALRATVAEARKNLCVVQAGQAVAEDGLKAAKQDVEDYTFMVEAFGSKGLRTIMLDRVRVMMQHHVNQYMLRLVGHAFRVTFPPSKSGFAIVLETEDGPVSVECFSKGEVWRANIAVLMALRKTLQYTRTTPLNFLVLDDPCSGSVDEVGVENIVETIRALSEEFDQVFVTLPQEVAVPYDRALLAVKDAEGFSELRSYGA